MTTENDLLMSWTLFPKILLRVAGSQGSAIQTKYLIVTAFLRLLGLSTITLVLYEFRKRKL